MDISSKEKLILKLFLVKKFNTKNDFSSDEKRVIVDYNHFCYFNF